MGRERKRVGEWVPLFAEIPPPLKARLVDRAAANRRSLTAELIVILESVLGVAESAPAKPARKSKKSPQPGKD